MVELKGNNKRREIILTDDTFMSSGLFVLAKFTIWDKTLTIRPGGNYRRMFYRVTDQDDYQLLDPSSLPSGVINEDGAYWDTAPLQVYRASQLAKTTRATIREKLGSDGMAAWDHSCESLIANPSMDETEWLLDYYSWGKKEGPFTGRPGLITAVDPAPSLDRICDLYVEMGVFSTPADKFAAMAAKIRELPAAAWRGEPVILCEEAD